MAGGPHRSPVIVTFAGVRDQIMRTGKLEP
jgi:hypothetical protein